MKILNSGSCETFKAGVHGTALGLAAIMGLYNGAAWLRRRERHLFVNTLLYGLAAVWESKHVAHHLGAAALRPALEPVAVTDDAGDTRPAVLRRTA